MKNKLHLLITLFVLASATIFATSADQRPNVIVILADDLGYSDVGFNRGADFDTDLGEIPTPHIDALADAGIICSNAHVTHPFCGPSRASILTGVYPHKIGAQYNLPNDITMTQGIDPDETYFSTVMNDAGYNTLAVGKWHLGFVEGKYQPLDRGFDEFFGFCGGGKNYFRSEYDKTWYKYTVNSAGYNDPALYNEPKDNHTTNEYMDPVQRNRDYVDRKEFAEDDYLTDVLTDETLDFIDRKAGEADPFMIYLAYNAPHTPLQAPEDEKAAFKVANPGFETAYRNSDYLLNSNQVTKYTDAVERQEKIDYYVDCRMTYATMVSNMDANIGRVVAKLKEEGVFDNTLIIFFSDNGGYTYSKGAVNYPLDALKGSTDEGGHRVPFFFHWPNKITTPAVYPYQISSLDVYPTLANVANGTIPTGKTIDGKDVLDDVIAGNNVRENEALFVMRPQNGFHNTAIVSYPYRMTKKGGNGAWKLFDVRVNPQQEIVGTTSGGAQVSAVVEELEDLGASWANSFINVRPAWFDNDGDGTGHPHRVHWFGENLVGDEGAMIFPDFARVFNETMAADVVAVDSVVMADDSVTIEVGQTYAFVKQTYPINATDKTSQWTLSNDTVAQLTEARTYEALVAGSVTVMVTTNDGAHQDSCVLTVVEAGGDTGGDDDDDDDNNGGDSGVTGDTIPGTILFEFEGRYEWTPQATCQIDVSANKGYDGSSNSVKMAYETAPLAQKHLSVEKEKLTGLIAGDYTISMQVYKEAGSLTEQIYFMVIGGTDAAVQLVFDITTLAEGSWQEVSLDYTATKDFDADAYLRFRTKATQKTGVIYIDNVKVAPQGQTSAVASVGEALDCKVFPNPVEDVLVIASPMAERVEVYSIMGELVMTTLKTEEPYRMDVSSLKAGTYIFQLSGQVQRASQVVVVR